MSWVKSKKKQQKQASWLEADQLSQAKRALNASIKACKAANRKLAKARQLHASIKAGKAANLALADSTDRGAWVIDDVHAAQKGRGSARRLQTEVAHMKLELEDHAEVQLDWNPKAELASDPEDAVSDPEDDACDPEWEPLHALNDVAMMNELSHGMAKSRRRSLSFARLL